MSIRCQKHRRGTALPCFPLIDDGLSRGTHPGREPRLTQAQTPAHGPDADVVVDRHRRLRERRTTIGWADCPPICTTAETPWPRRESRGPGGGERSSGYHRLPADVRPAPPPRSVFTCTPISNAITGNGRSAWSSRCVARRPRSCEHLRRRRPPPCIPRPVRLGGYTEHGRERRLRLAQRDPALTQRAGLHDVTPCHRHRPPASAGLVLGRTSVSQSWKVNRSLFFACTFAPGGPGRGGNRRIL